MFLPRLRGLHLHAHAYWGKSVTVWTLYRRGLRVEFLCLLTHSRILILENWILDS